MTENVVLLREVEAGFDMADLFESMKSREWQQVLVLTINEGGKFEWFGNMTAAEANLFMDRAKAWLVKDDPL